MEITWLRIVRRVVGFLAIFLVGPICFAVYGARHQYGQDDGDITRLIGHAVLLLGGWMLFAPAKPLPASDTKGV